jgi:hypothetical protein
MQTVRLDREASYASFVRDQGGKLKAAEVPPPPHHHPPQRSAGSRRRQRGGHRSAGLDSHRA